MFTAIVLSSIALAETPIIAGEMLDNAYTLPASTIRIQLLLPSSYGLTDELELKSSLFGLIAGPNLIAEYNLMRDGDRALSLSVAASRTYAGTTSGSVGGIYTLGSEADNRLSMSGRVGVVMVAEAMGVTLPLNVTYEAVTNPQTIWSFFGSTDPLTIIGGSATGTGAGASWTRGWRVYRLTLGMIITDTVSFNTSLVDAGLEPLPSPFLPLPYWMMWWTI